MSCRRLGGEEELGQSGGFVYRKLPSSKPLGFRASANRGCRWRALGDAAAHTGVLPLRRCYTQSTLRVCMSLDKKHVL